MLCTTSGARNDVLDRGGVERLLAGGDATERGTLEALHAVEEALEGVSRNLNPQATVAVLVGEMRRAFTDGA